MRPGCIRTVLPWPGKRQAATIATRPRGQGGQMLTDHYGLTLTTKSEAARDAYVRAVELTLTMYPGSIPLYDQALSADPGFALAHAGKARAFQLKGDVSSARAAISVVQSLAAGLPD